jgi:hypothetical protein
MAELVSGLSGRTFHDVSCGFRAYAREAMLQLNLHGRFTYTQETLLDLAFKGLRIREVPVRVRYFPERQARVSDSIVRYAFRSASIIFRLYRDYHPLRFFATLAASLIVVGAGFASIMVTHYLRTGMFSGQIWAGLVGAACVFVGIAFGILGVVADMLDRIRVNQDRILYLLKGRAGDARRVEDGDRR